jgi:hypothetical protein
MSIFAEITVIDSFFQLIRGNPGGAPQSAAGGNEMGGIPRDVIGDRSISWTICSIEPHWNNFVFKYISMSGSILRCII